jgi:hypothetical protein
VPEGGGLSDGSDLATEWRWLEAQCLAHKLFFLLASAREVEDRNIGCTTNQARTDGADPVLRVCQPNDTVGTCGAHGVGEKQPSKSLTNEVRYPQLAGPRA